MVAVSQLDINHVLLNQEHIKQIDTDNTNDQAETLTMTLFPFLRISPRKLVTIYR